MPAYTIPEEIVGIPLFVPEANDFFSVDSGGLPNGEDCLTIHGDINRNYKAFMTPPALTPNVFRSKTAIHSQVFWLRATGAAPSNTNSGEHAMMCIQESIDAQTNPANSTGTWHIGAVSGGTGRISYRQGNSGATLSIDGARTGNWKMITITNDGTTLRAYIDDSETVVSAAIAGSAITWGNQVLCIGAFSDNGALNGYEHEWRLGKWQFFDHVLNVTERAILYYTMTS